MKEITHLPFIASTTLSLLLTFASIDKLFGQTDGANAKESADDRIVSAVNTINNGGHSDIFDLFSQADQQRNRTIQGLLKVLNSPTSKRSAKLYAIYYLGTLHATEAIDSLASQITLETEGITGGSDYVVESEWSHISAADALARIGIQSIPAVIRNLSESDDTKTRDLSLRVLVHIDGDKDISQLRLQKAIKAETDPQKQARLQSALKALPGTSL